MAEWFYNPETLLYERVDEPRWKRSLRFVALIAGVAAVVVFNFWIYLFVLGWELPRTVSLKKINSQWQTRIELMNRHLDFYEETLRGLEERDDNVYRAIYGLNSIPEEMFAHEYGDAHRYDYLDEGGASALLKRTRRRIDRLSKRVSVRSTALDEVCQLSGQAGDMLFCVPAVPPLCPDKRNVRKTSSFGYRRDPVRGGGEYHQGVDFAAKKGTPIYSTGDGVIEMADFKFRGYGNEVVINHGYGYSTRYAHLQTIEVAEGMKVRRGERIGTVGNSGKSTGAHLHYEVIYRGRRVNPLNYMDLNMPADEYFAMIRARSEETPYDKRKSTTELIRRRRNSQ